MKRTDEKWMMFYECRLPFYIQWIYSFLHKINYEEVKIGRGIREMEEEIDGARWINEAREWMSASIDRIVLVWSVCKTLLLSLLHSDGFVQLPTWSSWEEDHLTSSKVSCKLPYLVWMNLNFDLIWWIIMNLVLYRVIVLHNSRKVRISYALLFDPEDDVKNIHAVCFIPIRSVHFLPHRLPYPVKDHN